MSAFPIFCGWDRRQREAAEVFKRSVIDRASIPVEIEFASADLGTCKRRGVTAFTYARFAVPHLCGHEGRALFVDGCDQLCLSDLTELADLDMGGAAVMVVKHGGVSLSAASDLVVRDAAGLHAVQVLVARGGRDRSRRAVDAVRRLPRGGDRRAARRVERVGVSRVRATTRHQDRPLVGFERPRWRLLDSAQRIAGMGGGQGAVVA